MRFERNGFSKKRHSLTSGKLFLLAGALLLAGAGMQFSNSAAAESAVRIPPPAVDTVAGTQGAEEKAVFAGGCFWGMQAVFQHTKGVLQAVSGYAGGKQESADYERVSSGNTGHAESVEITFDPRQISYGKLMQIYFSVAHDPTQLNRQYPDSGTQYRSAVFYRDVNQKQLAERYIAQLDKVHVFPSKIVTQLSQFSAFYPAETYHQDYATLHPESGYIARYDLPKIVNLKNTFPEVYREVPVLVASQPSVGVTNRK
jgi:peptide-methionine (S)-S-oxide reductase